VTQEMQKVSIIPKHVVRGRFVLMIIQGFTVELIILVARFVNVLKGIIALFRIWMNPRNVKLELIRVNVE
jgi:hypothetical protein